MVVPLVVVNSVRVALAIAEAKAAFGRVLQRFTNFELEIDEVVWRHVDAVRTPVSLPVSFQLARGS